MVTDEQQGLITRVRRVLAAAFPHQPRLQKALTLDPGYRRPLEALAAAWEALPAREAATEAALRAARTVLAVPDGEGVAAEAALALDRALGAVARGQGEGVTG
jgi:hypothetical protein